MKMLKEDGWMLKFIGGGGGDDFLSYHWRPTKKEMGEFYNEQNWGRKRNPKTCKIVPVRIIEQEEKGKKK